MPGIEIEERARHGSEGRVFQGEKLTIFLLGDLDGGGNGKKKKQKETVCGKDTEARNVVTSMMAAATSTEQRVGKGQLEWERTREPRDYYVRTTRA